MPGGPAEVRTHGPFVEDRPGVDAATGHVHLDARKRSLALDVTSPSGAALLDRLMSRVDVLVDDGVLGAPAAVRARYDSLLAAHPHLIVVALTPYGLDGPKADHRSSELCDLAASGWLTQNANHPDRAPIMPGNPCGELGVGTLAALGVALAVRARRKTGRGQLVEVPRQEALLSLLAFPTTLFACSAPTRSASVTGIRRDRPVRRRSSRGEHPHPAALRIAVPVHGPPGPAGVPPSRRARAVRRRSPSTC